MAKSLEEGNTSEPSNDAKETTTAPKSKIDTLSKEDLVRFVKKQIENVKQCKKENEQLRLQLDEEKTKREASTYYSALENGTMETENLGSSGISSELEAELKKMKAERADEQRLRVRERDDLEAAKAMCAELRSQLDDARTEAAALKENRAAADVFTLELKDYEKKVTQLQKDLKDTIASLATVNEVKDSLQKQLDEQRQARDEATSAEGHARETIDQLRRQLLESHTANSELNHSVSLLQEKVSSLGEERSGERYALARELAAANQRTLALEEAVDALREENERLRKDREDSDQRAAELSKDFDAFKSRAHFVLEQKARIAEEDTQKEELAQAERRISELQETIASNKKDERTMQDDMNRMKELNNELERTSRSGMREAQETQIALATTLDELRGCRNSLENMTDQLSSARRQIIELDSRILELLSCKEKLECALAAEHERVVSAEERLHVMVATEERRRKEEATRLALRSSEEPKKERVRPPPIAAVFPQFSEREDPRPNSSMSSKISGNTITDDAQDPSLEDVLFGDEIATTRDGDSDCEPTDLPGLLAELDRMRKLISHTTELLSETEAANARLNEQSGLLKNEIRRLERNEERKSHVENTEYLKNVIVKFLSPVRVSAEKQQLIPILTTMLRLSSEEVLLLQKTAAQDTADTSGSDASWGSYLRWGGLS